MVLGFILCLLVGISWTGIGIVLSFARHAGCRVERFFLFGSITAVVLITTALLCTENLTLPEGCAVPLIFLAAGALLNATAQVLTMLNLGEGGSAVYFAISRIGFSISFLWSVFVWNEKMSILNGFGLSFLLIAVVLSSLKKGQKGEPIKLRRLCLAIGASMCSGASQICIIFPSAAKLTNVSVSPLLSALVIMLVNCVFFGGWILLMDREVPYANLKALLKSSLAWGVLAVTSYAILFPAISMMAKCGRSGIVYPIGGAVMISAFALYTRYFLHEKLSIFHKIALVFIIAGIVAVKL